MTTCLLTIDTTTDACSAALSASGWVLSRREIVPSGHSARILGMIDELLAEAGVSRTAIDALGFCRGPGSFTGVRICAGVAQGIGLALDCALLPLSTLRVLAAGELATGDASGVLVVMDARMSEVYAAGYRRDAVGLPAPVGEERVCAPEALVLPDGSAGWHALGSGLEAYRERLPSMVARLPVHTADPLPDAHAALTLASVAFEAGEGVSPEAALPVYLRDRVAG